jgi:hypothetical protein
MEASQYINQEEHLKNLVRSYEERYISYKKLLEDIFKNKSFFPDGDEFVEWYKELLREGKNSSESSLKEFREELTDFRQGMNPPFCYTSYKRKNKDE